MKGDGKARTATTGLPCSAWNASVVLRPQNDALVQRLGLRFMASFCEIRKHARADDLGRPTGNDEIVIAKQRHGLVGQFGSRTMTFFERGVD
jgi:hypothetical protein